MELNYRELGAGDPVVVAHGLFGSASNWQSIARRLEDDHRWLLVDMRNHGDSPRSDGMGYPDMGRDLAGFIHRHCHGRAAVVGHSMGGKAAMALALEHPDAISGLVVVDVAPAAYRHRFTDYIEALCGIDLDTLKRRQEADEQLAEVVPEPAIRGFLLNNLRQRGNGSWYWRVNLAAMQAREHEIAGFPPYDAGQQYPGPTMFLYGGASEYLRDEHWPAIEHWFPAAQRVEVPGAGHWLHAEQPDQVAEHLRTFLNGLD